MPSFSERHNLKPKKMVQINNIDHESRVSIWNLFYDQYQNELSSEDDYDPYIDLTSLDDDRVGLFNAIWCDFLKKTIDTKPTSICEILAAIKIDFFHRSYHTPPANTNQSSQIIRTLSPSSSDIDWDWEWWKVYDFLEFISENDKNLKRISKFQDECNKTLEKEYLGYRFIDGIIAPITSEEEITEIENAIKNSTNEIQTHIEKSLKLLSNRDNPDFSNSIKESISAVEAQCKILAQDPTTTLWKALEKIEREKHVCVHRHLKEAFQKIYSWTNEDGGIRHALMKESNVDREDAQFMLIVCSAFINYLQVKKIKSDFKK